jgi:outer membrane lipoprotein-sorting protein
MRKLFLAFAIALIVPSTLTAQKLSLPAISAYLNALETVQSQFTQINDDGSLSTGTLYIKRPGRARFEYDGDDAALVIAGRGSVVIVDPRSNQRPESYPLNRTPLSIILARKVDLQTARMVVGHDFDGTATRVRAQDPKNPDYGSIDLYFTADPTELRKWVINGGDGARTTVLLGEMRTGVRIDNRLFDIDNLRQPVDR